MAPRAECESDPGTPFHKGKRAAAYEAAMRTATELASAVVPRAQFPE